MENFENKTVIITGASMGLGLAAAKEPAARGANLALVDYNERSRSDAKAEIAGDFPGAKRESKYLRKCIIGIIITTSIFKKHHDEYSSKRSD